MRTLVLLLFSLMLQVQAAAQDDMQLINDVARLQQNLKSPRETERDAAEKQLIELGEPVLDHLELTVEGDSEDYSQRVGRIRATLEKIAVKRVTQPASFKLESGNIKLIDLLTKIKEKTGNRVVLGRNVLRAVAESEIEIVSEAPDVAFDFWEIIELISEQTELQIDPYGGEEGELALSPVYRDPAQKAEVDGVNLTDISGVMRFEVTRIDSSRSFTSPQLNHGSLTIKMHWEPRIAPIAIDVPLNKFKIIDEFDKTYLAEDPQVVLPGMVTQSIPELEFPIRTALFDRQVEQLKTVQGVVRAVLPGRIETFKFKDVTAQAEGTSQTKAGATVTYLGARPNEELWGVRITLQFDDENNALDSHQSWVTNNVVMLVDQDGKRDEPFAQEVYLQSGKAVGIEYFFGENPKGKDLVYRTPAAIVNLDLPFNIEGIPLP